MQPHSGQKVGSWTFMIILSSTLSMAWGYDKFNRTPVFEHLFAGWAGYRE
jgi:hypothetical protein